MMTPPIADCTLRGRSLPDPVGSTNAICCDATFGGVTSGVDVKRS
jgi:hypothetical protein